MCLKVEFGFFSHATGVAPGVAVLVSQFTTLVQTEIPQQLLDGYAIKLICGPQRMKPIDFGDPLAFPLAHNVDDLFGF